ncbi:MAG: FmdB family zinc ribbon protein [Steroidobacteraceae bacterium]
MPFYEYQCGSCGHHLEAMQKITDAPLRKCPACGRSTLKKLLSAPVFRLKGSGWYETDFKTDKESKKNLVEVPQEEKKDEKKEEKKPEAKPESKPEAKPEAKAKPARKVGKGRKDRK